MTESPRDDERFLSPSSSSPSLSLAQHYIPDKLALYPSHWGAEARKTSRKATGGWGAAAGRKMGVSSSQSLNDIASSNSKDGVADEDAKGNGVLFKPSYRYPTSNSGSIGFSSSVYSSSGAGRLIGPPSSGHRNRKSGGAGRLAWGKDGGGIPALGAGDFEDDDGLDLSRDSFAAGRLPVQEGSTPGVESVNMSTSRLLDRRTSIIPRILGAASSTSKRGRWNKFKWCIVVMNTILTIYSIVGFTATVLVWTGMYKETKVLILVNRTELILSMMAMCLCLISAYLGWAGLLLNNRSYLSIYTLMLWISFIFIVAPGYLAYKQRTFNLSGKMNQIWSRQLSVNARRTVQVTLGCCGYYSPFIEAAADGGRCFARSLLPGCKGSLIDFEKMALQYIYVCSFAIVPMHLTLITVTLLCADHITYRFGKGVTPKEYRVDDNVIKQALVQQEQMHSSSLDHSYINGQLSQPRPPFWQHTPNTSSSNSIHTPPPPPAAAAAAASPIQ